MKTAFGVFLSATLALGLLPVLAASASGIQDSESATHAVDEAQHQIVDTYKFPGFEVVQVNLPVLSHYSYIVVSGAGALVVDPDRDVQFYLAYAKKQGLKIQGVYLTHSHADFVAGHQEIVKAVGCPVYQSADSGTGYKIEGLRDGSTFKVGTAVVKVLATPGHTPDGTCAVVHAGEADRVGKVAFTGDTLFIGSVGRPDLLEGTMSAAALASKGFDSWTGKLAKLDDAVLVLPAHGAGSLCGAHLSDSPKSTIGAERTSNPYLQHTSRSEFIMAILKELPETPPYFAHDAALNRAGPPLVDWAAPLPEETKPDPALTDPSKFRVVDLRSATIYAAEHIPSSLNIGLRGRLETWVGIMIPWDIQAAGKLILLGNKAELTEGLIRLNRIGYQAGVITLESWKAAGLPTRSVDLIKPGNLHALMKAGKSPMIVDIRLPSEWMGLRIGEVVNLPLDKLGALASKLDPAQPVVTVCNSAYRSSMAVGVLEGKGFGSVSSMAGGSEAWIQAGLPVMGSEVGKASPVAAAAPRRELRLADRISPDELRRLIKDLPGTFDLVDIRPAHQFADFNIDSSRNLDISDLIVDPSYLVGAGPLIIADRDGSLAAQVAGILSQKTKRTVKALQGGIEAYWKSSSQTLPAASPSRPSAGTPPATAPARDAPTTQPPRAPGKKSAGC